MWSGKYLESPLYTVYGRNIEKGECRILVCRVFVQFEIPFNAVRCYGLHHGNTMGITVAANSNPGNTVCLVGKVNKPVFMVECFVLCYIRVLCAV